MQKLDIPVVNLPGTPVRLMSLLIQILPVFLSRLIMKKAMASGRGGKMPSFYLDLESGRKKSEVVFLNGAVARLAKLNGFIAPVNQSLTEILMGIVSGTISAETYAKKPEELIRKIL